MFIVCLLKKQNTIKASKQPKPWWLASSYLSNSRVEICQRHLGKICKWDQQIVVMVCMLYQDKARDPFLCSRLRYLCGCITLINWSSTEAVMWLLLCSCVRITDVFIFFYQSMQRFKRNHNAVVTRMPKRSRCLTGFMCVIIIHLLIS